jgi:hypothetical protein
MVPAIKLYSQGAITFTKGSYYQMLRLHSVPAQHDRLGFEIVTKLFMAVMLTCRRSRMMVYEGKVPSVNPDQLILRLL